MAQRRRRGDSQRRHRQLLITTGADMALVKMDIGVAQTAARDLDDHLARLRPRVGEISTDDRCCELDVLKRSHGRYSPLGP
jgi:hypothetical protein